MLADGHIAPVAARAAAAAQPGPRLEPCPCDHPVRPLSRAIVAATTAVNCPPLAAVTWLPTRSSASAKGN